ncbi:MAG TPA: FkbM family methyltransferase [Dongiaceae bacterium]|nr:FkbM family methyltransferase [Dongiaceae bacterium]
MRLLAGSGLFDKKWYRSKYPDAAAAGVDPIEHYWKHGAAKGYDPSPAFDTLWYLETNRDVAQVGVNPLYHYIKFGRREGRTPTPAAGVMTTPADTGTVVPASDPLPQTLNAPTEREQIQSLLRASDPSIAHVIDINADAWAAIIERKSKTDEPLTVVVTHNEINNAHGTGVLVQRMFGDLESVLTIRPWSSFGNKDQIGFANLWLGNKMLTDQQLYRLFSFLLAGQKARCVVVVPYDELDLRVALRVSEILSAPLVPYIMDDNNVIGRRISDRTMQQAVQNAAVRFVISAEMRQAYEGKFGQKFFVLPPLVPPRFLDVPVRPRSSAERGIIIGNIWAQEWLDELLRILEEAELTVDWICNTSNPRWLTFDRNEIARRGLNLVDPMPEEQLVERIRRSPFCILPTDSGVRDPSAKAIARLSLPSRVVLIVAAGQVPVIVVGDNDSAAVRFVHRFGVGVGVPYESGALKAAIENSLEPVARAAMRANASNISRAFSSEGIEDWLFRSVIVGQAIDDRFDSLFTTEPGDIAFYVDRPCPPEIGRNMTELFRALRRLKDRGFSPDFVVDAGASNGIWSHTVAALYPKARFVLVEPLFDRYKSRSGLPMIERRANFEPVQAALLDNEGEISIQVSGDIYNSSTMAVRLTGVEDVVTVPVTTLDRLAADRRLSGRGLVKIDVQFAEHLVLDGGRELLANQVDAVVIEMTLRREHPDALTFLEICEKMKGLGFDYDDDAGEWRSPIDGRLEQKDVIFVRRDACFA